MSLLSNSDFLYKAEKWKKDGILVQKVGTAGTGQTTVVWTIWDLYEKMIGNIMTRANKLCLTLTRDINILYNKYWKQCPMNIEYYGPLVAVSTIYHMRFVGQNTVEMWGMCRWM